MVNTTMNQGTGSPSCLELPLLPRRYLTSTAGTPIVSYVCIYIYIHMPISYIVLYIQFIIWYQQHWDGLPVPTRQLVNLTCCCSFVLSKIPLFVGEMFCQFSRPCPTIKPNSSLEPFKTFNTYSIRNSWAQQFRWPPQNSRVNDTMDTPYFHILSWHIPEISQCTNRQPRSERILSQWPNCSSECTKAVWDVHLVTCSEENAADTWKMDMTWDPPYGYDWHETSH